MDFQHTTQHSDKSSVWYSVAESIGKSQYIITQCADRCFNLYTKYRHEDKLIGSYPTLSLAQGAAEYHYDTIDSKCQIKMLNADRAQVFIAEEFAYSLFRKTLGLQTKKTPVWVMYSKQGFIVHRFYSICRVRTYFERRGYTVV